MTAREIESLRVDALALPEPQRAALARDLVASLDGSPDSDAAAAWDSELCRRIAEAESGKAEVIGVDEAIRQAREQLIQG